MTRPPDRRPNTPCHRCDRAGLIWLTPEGQVVARDHLNAYVAFQCSHDTRMNNIKDRHEKWQRDRFTDIRIRSIKSGDANRFETR